MPTRSHEDENWMARAFRQARKGQGLTRPNPPVGAVIVKRGTLISEGTHRRAGLAHAEIDAIRRAGAASVKGGTLYVSLEPCSTRGRTDPCTDAIIAAGITRVVYSVADPNPENAGRARRQLARAGIEVCSGVLRKEGLDLIKPFAHRLKTGRPYVRLKLAVTLDGNMADRNGHSQWISAPASRQIVQEMRRTCDAVIVGVGTVIADDPSLTYRRAAKQERYRVILDSRARLPITAKVLNDGYAGRTILATTRFAPASRLNRIRAKGAEVWVLPSKGSHVSLRHALQRMGERGFLSVVCEGGGTIAHALQVEDFVDELTLFMAPKWLGSDGLSAMKGTGWLLRHAPRFYFSEIERVGPDLMIRALPC